MRRRTRGRFQDRRRNRGGAAPLEKMLDMHRIDYFLYDAKEIFFGMGVEENVWSPLLSSIVAKASRTSIEEAREYITQKVEDGSLPKEAEEQLFRLLNKYSRMR